MEALISFICAHAQAAHWIFLILLILAGINIPISEDFLLLSGGAIAATCIPEDTYHLYAWMFAGCWISAWEAYWLGRLLGPKLYILPWFRRFITPQRIDKLHHYYERFGILTFIVGRFIPGGVRNAIFMTSGLGKMHFGTFMLRDCIACLISSSVLFTLGYQFGEHYPVLIHYFKKYELILGCTVLVLGLGAIVYVFKSQISLAFRRQESGDGNR